MSIQEKFQKVAETMTDYDYKYMSWQDLNIEFDGSKRPVIAFIPPVTGVLNVGNVRSFDAPNIMIAMMAPITNTDDDKATIDKDVRNKMMADFQTLVAKLNYSNEFEWISGNISYEAINDLDAYCAGYLFRFTLKDKKGVPLCPQ